MFKKKLSLLLIIMATLLISLNLSGFIANVSVVKGDFQHVHDSDLEGYSTQIQSTKKLKSLLRKPVDNFDLAQINQTVFKSLMHSDLRHIQVHENWLLWIASKIHKPLTRTQNPNKIVAGEGALCSEASIVINKIAMLNGLQTRFLQLRGHVISEVKTKKGWRAVDPDYGITYPGDIKTLEGKEGALLMSQLLQQKGYKDPIIKRYISIVQTTEDNEVTAINTALSPRMDLLEKITEVLIWVIPLALLFLGIVGLNQHAKNSRTSIIGSLTSKPAY